MNEGIMGEDSSSPRPVTEAPVFEEEKQQRGEEPLRSGREKTGRTGRREVCRKCAALALQPLCHLFPCSECHELICAGASAAELCCFPLTHAAHQSQV